MDDRLESTLRDLLASTIELEQAMSAERDALANRDIEALEAATTRKAALIGAVETLQSQIGDRPLAEQIAEAPTSSRLLLEPLHEKLASAIDRCRYQNSVNGKVIGRSQQSTAALIRMIAGTDNAALYDRSGRSHPDSEGADIARV